MSVAVIASGACAGTGVTRDPELAAAGLTKPFCARVPLPARPRGVKDRACVLLEDALGACARDLDEVMPGWRSLRVGAAIGTSSGGMRAFEERFRELRGPVPDPLAATYVGPLAQAARPCAFEPCSLVLGACASSTIAIGLGRAWLEAGACDLALCGGFDAVSVFVARGFECLRATSASPRPFRAGRDGLALGEGAAIVALARRKGRFWVSGFGASCDASHLTAPERSGGGLARAGALALEAAGRPRVDLVSAHGTATPQNDAAEAAAIATLLGDRVAEVPVFSVKGVLGHTLGAAGALEVLAAANAMASGWAPASEGVGPIEGGLRVLDAPMRHPAETTLKLSSAFGGANAALVLGAEVPHRPPRGCVVSRAVAVDAFDAAAIAAATGYPEGRIARADDLVRLALAAVLALERRVGSLRGAGIVVGHGLATIETNLRFLARAEPRRFPYTSPNACAGECAVAFGLTGPAFAAGGGPHGGIEAIADAAALVGSGLADRVVVVAVDEAGEASGRIAPGTRSGAVALVVAREDALGGEVARLEACGVRLEALTTPLHEAVLPPMDAHRALLPLAAGRPEEIRAEIPWGGVAWARFAWPGPSKQKLQNVAEKR